MLWKKFEKKERHKLLKHSLTKISAYSNFMKEMIKNKQNEKSMKEMKEKEAALLAK